VIDYGLVTRAECQCGDVIIVASNARPETIVATIRRHNARARHRAYYGDPVMADTDDGTASLGFSPSATPRSRRHGGAEQVDSAGIHLPANEARPFLDAYESRLRR
jgi:hypothetical protein